MDETRIQALENKLLGLQKQLDDFVLHTHNGFDSSPIFYKTIPLQNRDTDPEQTKTGVIAVVSGKLKIYDGASWVVVGAQV